MLKTSYFSVLKSIKNKKLFAAVCSLVSLVLIAAVVLGITFGLQNKNTVKISGFNKMNDEEKADSVMAVVRKNYGEKSTLESSVDAVESGYKALIGDGNGDEFSIWIDENGVITDTSYALQFNDKVSEYVQNKLKSNFKDCKAFCKVYCLEKPDKDFNENMDTETFIKAKGVTTVCNIVIGNNEKNIDVSAIKESLQNITGTLKIYMVLNTSEITSYDDVFNYEAIETITIGEHRTLGDLIPEKGSVEQQ